MFTEVWFIYNFTLSPLPLTGVAPDSGFTAEQLPAMQRLVVRACARAMIGEGLIVHAYLEDNEPEIRAMKGWRRVSGATWMWWCGKQ